MFQVMRLYWYVKVKAMMILLSLSHVVRVSHQLANYDYLDLGEAHLFSIIYPDFPPYEVAEI